MARTKKDSAPAYVVAKPFKDKPTYGSNVYKVGDAIENIDSERLENMIKRGLVIKTESVEENTNEEE